RSPSQVIRQSVLELKLQAEESFVLKVVQLEELLQVRHSVFVIGNAGCGKSQVAATPSPRTRVPSCPNRAHPTGSLVRA
ncbi:DYH17 protein, partial [Corythaeola cristata]|nr:DYH17 protein [Corythaeola cristata]